MSTGGAVYRFKVTFHDPDLNAAWVELQRKGSLGIWHQVDRAWSSPREDEMLDDVVRRLMGNMLADEADRNGCGVEVQLTGEFTFRNANHYNHGSAMDSLERLIGDD